MGEAVREPAGRTAAWRIAFGAYALLLFAATHWPAPSLPLGDVPMSDKAAHAGAFAVWTWLLFRAAPPRGNSWRGVGARVVIALSYAVVDEGLQMIPALRRSAEWADLAANALGVAAGAVVGVTTGAGRVSATNASQIPG